MQNLRTTTLTLAVLLALLAGACSTGSELSATAESPARPADGAGEPVEGEGGEPSDTTPDGSGEEPGTTPNADDPFCDAAQRIRDLDDQSNEVMSEVVQESLTSPEQAESRYLDALAEVEALLPELTTAYDDLEAAAPENLRDDVDLVRSFTLSLMEKLTSIESIEDFDGLTEGLDTDSAAAAAAATFELDTATRERCDISLAN